MKTTTITLKTLTLATASATFTLASPPSAIALDWHANPGQTQIDAPLLDPQGDVYDNIFIGAAWVGGSAVDIVSGGVIEFTNSVSIGTDGYGDVAVYDGGILFSNNQSGLNTQNIQVGSGYGGQLRVFEGGYIESAGLTVGTSRAGGEVTVEGFNARLSAATVRVDYGRLSVSDQGAVSVDTEMAIADFSEVEVFNQGLIQVTRLMMNIDSSLSVGIGGLMVVNGYFEVTEGAKFTIGLSTNVSDSGRIQLNQAGSVQIFGPASLAVHADGEFAAGEHILILEGLQVRGLWGYDPIVADTGQVFDIAYDKVGIGPLATYETYLVARAIPEPSTYALIGGLGAVALAMGARWRRRR
ncbi:MAG: PEP-CTERM sorting domain-containing protein [Puniceicoccales bacterium]|jgi:hypothetical protein|nr:PEP-CTERM sorting domain-containing protein [Puniceicoccales bacterium]